MNHHTTKQGQKGEAVSPRKKIKKQLIWLRSQLDDYEKHLWQTQEEVRVIKAALAAKQEELEALK